jgi:hypothetical protein
MTPYAECIQLEKYCWAKLDVVAAISNIDNEENVTELVSTLVIAQEPMQWRRWLFVFALLSRGFVCMPPKTLSHFVTFMKLCFVY